MAEVNTKTAPRRPLQLRTLADIRAEVDRFAAAGEASLRVTGNWSPGQILWHVGAFMGHSIDGFPGKPPRPIRFIMKLLFRKRALETDQPMPSGFKLPRQASFLLPPDDVSLDEGLAQMRTVLDRVQSGGETMTQESPVLGPMTHDDWIKVHGKHASMHFSFIDPGAAS